MKRVLIIASCGLITALIIGATTEEQKTKSHDARNLPEKKCIEPSSSTEPAPLCMTIDTNKHADMFLRSQKRKEKRMFALSVRD